MRKVLIIALAIVAGASFSTADAKKKKEKKQEKVVMPVTLQNGSDTLSYAAGQSLTNGLIPYLIQSQGVDTTFMADFIEGFKQALAAKDNPREKARLAGMEIAGQVTGRMLPGMQKEFTDTPDTLVAQLLYRGFTDALTGDTTVMKVKEAEVLFRQKQESNKAVKDERLYGPNREAGRRFLAENKTKDSVFVTPSGLQYKILVKGEGIVPQRTDKVLVNYEGRLVDGTVFDASARHGDKPASFRADQVIKGWTEALTMMPVGSKWQLYIPYELAYGERNMGNIKPFSALIFDVELVGIE
jgi:FKBP-type peptidyl-prolyl cis-trans isomerase FklB